MLAHLQKVANKAGRIFKKTRINITQTPQKHLGAVTGELNPCEFVPVTGINPRKQF